MSAEIITQQIALTPHSLNPNGPALIAVAAGSALLFYILHRTRTSQISHNTVLEVEKETFKQTYPFYLKFFDSNGCADHLINADYLNKKNLKPSEAFLLKEKFEEEYKQKIAELKAGLLEKSGIDVNRYWIFLKNEAGKGDFAIKRYNINNQIDKLEVYLYNRKAPVLQDDISDKNLGGLNFVKTYARALTKFVREVIEMVEKERGAGEGDIEEQEGELAKKLKARSLVDSVLEVLGGAEFDELRKDQDRHILYFYALEEVRTRAEVKKEGEDLKQLLLADELRELIDSKVDKNDLGEADLGELRELVEIVEAFFMDGEDKPGQ